jgi:hypothetical protein
MNKFITAVLMCAVANMGFAGHKQQHQGLVGKTVEGGETIVKDTGKVAGTVVKDTGKAAGNIVKGTGKAVGNVLKSI